MRKNILSAIELVFVVAVLALPAFAEEAKSPEPEFRRDPELAKLSSREIQDRYQEAKAVLQDTLLNISAAQQTAENLNAIATKLDNDANTLATISLPENARKMRATFAATANPPPTHRDLADAEYMLKNTSELLVSKSVEVLRVAGNKVAQASRGSPIGTSQSWYAFSQRLYDKSKLPETFDQVGIGPSGANNEIFEGAVAGSEVLRTYAYQNLSNKTFYTTNELEPLPSERQAAELALLTQLETQAIPALASFIKQRIQNMTSAARGFANDLTSEATTATASKPQKEALVTKLGAELAFREKAGESRQTTLANNLIQVILCVLVAMLVGVLIIRMRNDEVSRLLIHERTVVEVVSIGGFLTVVLFLGAGEFVQKETLGTLLGTLAGYLFTRRPSATADATAAAAAAGAAGAAGAASVPVTPQRPPAAAAAPTWDAATKKLSLAAPTLNATKYLVWILDTAGNAPVQVAAVATPSCVIPADLLIAGHHYEAWFQASNAAGDGPPGAHASFSA